MGLSASSFPQGKQLTFTAIVSKVGTEFMYGTYTPTRMLFDVQAGEVTEEHSWIQLDMDAKLFARFAFGDKVTFRGYVEPYPGNPNKVGIQRVSGVMKIGRATSTDMHYMLKVNDNAVTRMKGVQQHLGISKEGKEIPFANDKLRNAYMGEEHEEF